MIKSVTVINHLNQRLEISLRNPEKSGFLITDISGLGPVAATINTTEIMSTNGAIFNSSRLGSRNLVLTLRYLWAETIEDARLSSYRWFPVGKKVTIIVETDNRKAYVEGWVESNEPVIFSEACETQVSIICPSSFFRDYNNGRPYEVSFDAVTASFEFPFSNESTSDKLLIFGTIETNLKRIVNYVGDFETGVKVVLIASGDVSGTFGMYNLSYDEGVIFRNDLISTATGDGFTTGDRIEVDTNKGYKSAVLYRGSDSFNILHCLAEHSKWLTLRPGENELAFRATSGEINVEASLEYDQLYRGV